MGQFFVSPFMKILFILIVSMEPLCEKGAIMRAKLFVCFCSKNYIGTQDEDLSTAKVLATPSLPSRSKAKVLV